MGALDSLAGALQDQLEDMFDLGENKNRSLDIVEGGHTKKYGKLGDFAKKFDQSAERNYVEEGYLRKDLFNVDPKQREIIMQEPNITILVKKRMFSTVAENFRPDLMDADEKIFFKATRILFENKCRQLAAFEKLCRIERATSVAGEFDTALLPMIIGLANELSNTDISTEAELFSSVSVSNRNSLGEFGKAIDQIKKVYTFSPNRQYTSWIKDNNKLFAPQLGEGTGVIELTNVRGLTTNTTVHGDSGGNCSLDIVDPYELMVITETDIERALSDATNVSNNHLIFRMGQESTDTIIARNTKLLNDKRRARGASNITFKINPDTLLSRRVIAIVDSLGEEINFTYDAALGLAALGIGKGVEIDPSCLRGGALLEEEGLATKHNQRVTVEVAGVSLRDKGNFNSEENLFKDIIINIFNKLQLDGSSKSINRQLAKENNYARRKIRFNFLGKLIIQPMDQIHIYIGSKSSFDNKVLGGLQNSFTGLGFLQSVNNSLTDIKNIAYTLFKPSGNLDFEMEKSVIMGPNFSSYWWGVMRNQFVNERSGTHVFGGIIKSADSSYGDGSFSVRVNGQDNMEYFNQGFVNFKPSADVWNGALYDPLTPYKNGFDIVSSNADTKNREFLQENQIMLASEKFKGILKYTSGPLAGKSATEANAKAQDQSQDSKNNKKEISSAPPGLVYKWKEGIGTFVSNYAFQTVNNTDAVVSAPAAAPPLAGQDVMNSLSLLITGEPYNYATFYKGTRDFEGTTKDTQANQNEAFSFYDSFKKDLAKRNMMWGNFIPFKNLIMDEEQLRSVVQAQISIFNANVEINSKLTELQEKTNQLMNITRRPPRNHQDAAENILKQEILKLQQEINDSSDQIYAAQSQSKNSLQLVGNDVSFNFDNFLNSNDGNKTNKTLFDPSVRRKLRKKVNFITRRFSWQVRSNEDRNLFIVDDTYDKDYDILAFEKSFNGYDNVELFNSQFIPIKDKIIDAASILNIEVFCDSQGHIRARPPQYNKVPSSIFYRMLQLKDESGIQIFPDFLKNLIVNQVTSAINRIETIEDLIRLDIAILSNKTTNEQIQGFINSTLKGTPQGSGSFIFFSNENGKIGNALDIVKNTDLLNKFSNTAKTTQELFSAPARVDVLFNRKLADPPSTVESNQFINRVADRLKGSGQEVNIDGFLFKNAFGTITNTLLTSKRIDMVKLTGDLADKIGDRQKLISIANTLLNNYIEVISVDSDKSIGNKLVIPGAFSNKKSDIPEIFENMIEDESYDDLGPGSGSRYVIKNNRILSYNIRETAPDYTMVEVSGVPDPNTVSPELDPKLNIFPGGGNAVTTAAAVDFDTWRMYGFKIGTPIKAPFLSNPLTQCAPYAAAVLSRARKNILRGTVTIVGNEYMQPGEVIYLEQRGLLFYVDNVSHNFTYDNQFQTTLELTYGHSPGEYIPTTFDVIGKMIYNNRDKSQIINMPQSNSYDEISIGTVILDKRDNKNKDNNDNTKLILSGPHGTENLAVIKNMLYSAAYKVNAHASKGSNIQASVEIRLYSYDGNFNNSDLILAADALKKILTEGIPADSSGNKKPQKIELTFDKSSVKVEKITLNEKGEPRAPSSKAHDRARNIAKGTQMKKIVTKNDSGDKTVAAIVESFNYILDCYIKFKQLDPDEAGKSI